MGKFVWSREITLQLINLYQKHPLLYSTRHVDYKNRRRRDEAIEAIKRELCRNSFVQNQGLSVSDIKMKIHGLRTQYFKEIKKMQEMAASGQYYTPPLWSFEQLSFLKDDLLLKNNNESIFDDTVQLNEIDSEGDKQPQVVYQNHAEALKKTAVNVADSPPPDIFKNSPKPSSTKRCSEDSSNSLLTMASNALKDCINKGKEDDLVAFARLVQVEMTRIQNKAILRRVKKDILNVLMEAQSEDSEN